MQLLGGAAQTGGVTVGLDPATTGGAISVQQVPNNTSLPTVAIAAIQNNPLFAVSSATFSVAPQIWNVNYAGSLDGGTASLVFHYDPGLLPAGTDEPTLVIWHFNSVSNVWEHGGTVNTTDHTVTYVTTSFSPFELGTAIAAPEPSSIVLAAMGFVGLAAWGWRRQKRSRA